MPRTQSKRMQDRVYHYLQEQGEPKTAKEIIGWYQVEFGPNTSPNGVYVRAGKHTVTDARALSNVLRRSLLFDCVGRDGETTRGLNLWVARPLDAVVERAIASNRPIEKYPAFLQKEMRRVLNESN